MQHVAASEHEAPQRLPDDDTQQFVLQTVATHAESLLRTAQRHSLCADDAHDAYQRGLEIFMRRAATLDRAYVDRWLHVVVKHEAMEVRRGRSEHVAVEDVDYDLHACADAADPEERMLSTDRSARAAEALRRLKPQELRAIWLKALGHTYDEIATATGFSPTKVNRCLTEGRRSFLERYAGIESGDECRRWEPVLSAMIDGEASAEQVGELRPHLRNCASCRATLKGLHESQHSLAAVLPMGVISAGLKLGGLLDRIVPLAGTADTAGAAGGLSVLGVGGAKLVGLLAAGAAATAGGGLVVAHERAPATPQLKRDARPRAAKIAPAAAPTQRLVSATRASEHATSAAAVVHRTPAKRTAATRALAAQRSATTGRIEFAPAGGEIAPAPATAPIGPAAGDAAVAKPSPPKPVATSPSSADAASGEFAPQP
jgi:RNA polymerase sigma factor (sigma-70 family)